MESVGKMFKRPNSRPNSYAAPAETLGPQTRPDRSSAAKPDKDIEMSVGFAPATPSMEPRRFRKFSQFSMLSDASDQGDVPVDSNSNAVKTKSRSLLQQKARKPQKLNLAALSGNEEEVKRLLSKGVDVNIKDSFGKTPLHNAILSKQVGIVDVLLKSGADVKCLDEKGDTPLHNAVRVGNQEIVEELLKHSKCEVNVQGFMASTPLHIAAQTDNVEICKKLVELDSDVTRQNDNRMTPLGVAVTKGAQSVVEYFFEVAKEKDLDIDALLYQADADGSTLLHLAVDSGILQIVILCLRNGAKVRQTKESNNSTAFHVACAQGSLDIVQLLHNEDREIIKLNMIDDQSMTPLHRAAASNHTQIASFLLEQGAHVNARDMECRTPLFLAASVGGTETVQLLMDRNADVTIKDVELRSVLHAAIGNSGTMEVLTKSAATRPLIVEKDVSGFAPIHYATRAGHVETVALFISKNKAATTVTSDSMFTPLHIAAKYGWLNIVKMIGRKRDVRMINCQTNKDKTPLHFACHEGHDEIAELLLMEGATIERDHLDRTPLHLAAMCGSERCVDSILRTHPDCLNFLDKSQNTALNLAAMHGHAGTVTYLLSVPQQRVPLNARKQNVMDMAISAGKEDVAMAIMEHDRWKEVVESAAGGAVSQLQTLVAQMPEVAERFLDQCVEKEGDPSSKDFKITYDLKLIQGKENSVDSDTFENSLTALKTMAERRRENCLTHPVCYVLMNIKWKRFGWITYFVNLSLYLAFLLPFTALAVYQKNHENEICGYKPASHKEFHNSASACVSSDKTVSTLHYIVVVFAIVHLSKECLQVFRQRLKYIMSITNYIEWMIYLAALIYLLPVCACKQHFQPEAAAFSLFFGWLNLVLYFRRLSFYGKYVIMLITMFKTLVQVMLLFLLFVIAFGTTFYILMYKQKAYGTYYHSLMKTFAMTLGELNYNDAFIEEDLHYPTAMNVLFVLFCLGMPIILMNMLIGLAVGDIDNIQQKSMMERYVMQVELLLEIEESLPAFIMRRVQVDWHEEFPNRKVPLRTKVKEKLIGFGQADNSKTVGEENIPPAIAQVIERMQEQESRINEMHEMMKEQGQLLKLISRTEGVNAGGRKGFMTWFKKK